MVANFSDLVAIADLRLLKHAISFVLVEDVERSVVA